MRSFFESAHPRTGARGSVAPAPSDRVDARVLSANIAERHTLPSDARFVVFSASADFFAKFGDGTVAAAAPSSDIADGSAAELNPAARAIPVGVTHVSLVATSGCVVTLSFYGA